MAFNPRFFYIFNSTSLNNYTLSSGQNQDTNGYINMTQNAFSSSENWQIFPQGGRYFIRNFDYGSSVQLGLTQSDQKTPRLYPQSGDLGQQWSIMQTQGGWQLVNGLIGNGTTLNIQGAAAPQMQSGDSGTTWLIVRNPSAETAKTAPIGSDMYSQVPNFEVASSSTASSISSATAIVMASGAPSAPSNTLSVPDSSSTSGSSASSPSSSHAFGTGAIIGVIIGGVAFLVLLIFAVWFLAHKRRATKQERYELYGQENPMPMRNEKFGHRAELDSIGPASAADRQVRAELA